MGGPGAQGWWSEQGQAWAASVGFLLYQHFSWCFLPGCPFRNQPPLPSPGHISPLGSGTWPTSLLWGGPLESLHIRGQRLRAPGASQTGRGLKAVWWGGAGKVGETLRGPFDMTTPHLLSSGGGGRPGGALPLREHPSPLVPRLFLGSICAQVPVWVPAAVSTPSIAPCWAGGPRG